MRDDLRELWGKDRLLLSIVAITLLLAPLIFFYQMWLGYQQQIESAENTTRNVAVLLYAELNGTLHRVDGSLREIAKNTPLAALQGDAVARHERQIDELLATNQFKFGEVGGFSIADAEGDVLYSSAGPDAVGTHIADHAYFSQLRDGAVRDLVFSEVAHAHTSAHPEIVVARALRDEQGRFRGAACAIIDIDRFEALFRSLSLGPDAVIELRRSDNQVRLVRWPALPSAVDPAPPAAQPAPTRAVKDAATALVTLHLADPLDGVERILSIHALAEYPWAIHVSLGKNQALAEWRTRMWLVAALMLLFLSLFLAALQRFFRMSKAEQHTVRSLQQSEERFRRLFENNDSVMMWIDPANGVIVGANQAASAFYGYPAERLTGMSIAQIEATASMPAPAAGAPIPSRHETSHRLADGTVRNVEVYATALDFTGRPLLYLIVHDITDRRLAENALRDERDRSQMYLNLVETVIVALDCEGRIASVNRKGCQLFGRSADELIGRAWSSWVHRGKAALIAQERYRRVMTEEQPLAEYIESDIELPDGGRLQMAWHNALMRDDRGRVFGLLIAGTDITERKRIEGELEGYRRSLEQLVAERTMEFDKLNRRLTLAARAANIGVWEWELATDQVYWNEQMSQIYGVPHEPVLPAAVRTRAVLTEDLAYVANNMQVILSSSGEGEAGEFRIHRPSGEIRYLYSTGTVVRDDHGKVLRAVGINVDITERKRVESQLREARDIAEASDRAKSEFLANVTHELRTPLNAVIGMTNLASELCTDARQRDYLNKILISGKHLNRLINDLLDLTKIAAGHLEIESIPFSPRTLVVRCNSVMAHRAATKKLALREIIADDVPDPLLGDPLRIEQILLNLVGNAIKFTLSGSVEVRIDVAAREAERVCLQISVQDTGIGMADADLARLFNPFTQADATVSRRFGGTGLGLAISKRLAELMDGDIGVTSRPGQGSVFTVRLWLRLAAPGALPQPAPAVPDVEPVRFRDTQVLVVEDQSLNREIVEALLSNVGITTCTAENGQEALYILKKSGAQAFDLVLMDIQMPIMDGLTTTRELRRWPGFANLPIIAMTAHTMAHEKEEALAAGMNDHIGKPFDNAHFLRTLVRWINPAKQESMPARAPGPAAATSPPAQPGSAKRGEVPGLDWQSGLARFNDREDRYRHWLADFATTSDAAVASIRARIESGDHPAAAALAHALKGRTGMLGMTGLHQQVAALETALRDGRCDAGDIARLETAIGLMCDRLHSALAPAAQVEAEVTLATQPWDETLSVGNATLDRQHQELFAIVDELIQRHAARLRGEDVSDQVHEVLTRLIARTEHHCRSEENDLKTLAYPGLADHEKEHAALLATLAAHGVPRAALDIRTTHQALQQALRLHILKTDMQYRRYIEECNLNF